MQNKLDIKKIYSDDKKLQVCENIRFRCIKSFYENILTNTYLFQIYIILMKIYMIYMITYGGTIFP